MKATDSNLRIISSLINRIGPTVGLGPVKPKPLNTLFRRVARSAGLLMTVMFAYTTAALADSVVTATDDSGPGTLRQAILDANANVDIDGHCVGVNNISFNFPATNAISTDLTVNYYKIAPLTPLPIVECPINIDGYTQPATSSFVAPALAGASHPLWQVPRSRRLVSRELNLAERLWSHLLDWAPRSICLG